MELFGFGINLIVLLVGFGLLIGTLFGFFGMGGSFLVTPALLAVGYPATVAVGSGLAFVFGTSVPGALRHRCHDQINYKLAVLMLPGLILGIEVGKRVVFLFDGLGSADFAISVIYVGLLGAVGLFVLLEARTADVHAEPVRIATELQAVKVPPMVALSGGGAVSIWIVLVVGLAIGVLSGCLGVGGGFLLLPVMVYGFGISAGIAAGTSILQIMVSGAFGTFVYAQSNAINVPVVTALLVGSALGARIGAAVTRLVNEADLKGYFAVMLLAGSVATASKLVGIAYGVETLGTASAVLIFGSAFLVSGVIAHAAIDSLKKNQTGVPTVGQ